MALVAKQPTEIFICNTSNIDSMRHGRPQTVMITEQQIIALTEKRLPNGAIVALGDTLEQDGTSKPGNILDHVHAALLIGTAGQAAGVDTPEIAEGAVGKFIVVSPEIRVEQYRRIDNSIANHMLIGNETYTAYELQLRDRIEYSLDYFDDATQATLAGANAQGLVGSTFKMNNQGLLEPGAELRIVSVREQSKPLMYAPHAGGAEPNLMNKPVIMVKVEVVK